MTIAGLQTGARRRAALEHFTEHARETAASRNRSRDRDSSCLRLGELAALRPDPERSEREVRICAIAAAHVDGGCAVVADAV